MNPVKVVVIEGPNFDHRSLGMFELEPMPRIGETIWHEKEDDDGPKPYCVKYINYFLEPKDPTEIWLVSLDEANQQFRSSPAVVVPRFNWPASIRIDIVVGKNAVDIRYF